MKKADVNKAPKIWDRSRQFTHKLYWSVKYYGLDLTILAFMIKILSFLSKDLAPTDWYKRTTSRRFDKRFGVDTAGCITTEQLDISNHQKQQAIQYQPTASVTFRLMLSELPINYSDYVFVDYGSGKGRALILAAHFPFKRIVGVDVSNKLHQIAHDNIRRFLAQRVKCRNILSVCEDATTFDLPNEPLVIYLFHPFKQEVLTAVLNNIGRSLEHRFRHIIILYRHPQHPEIKNLLFEAEFLRKADDRN
ncbi:MAG: hypothetical protein GWN00_29020 [Aliifodinibius sp.]|nr:class I SAM-dependent methyltransferase [Fodinibius sp.]NIV14816.1 hypothetical protein [Fodinibius sp.]NIY28695.1 hypothetical protein [Fodinibius sp.]